MQNPIYIFSLTSDDNATHINSLHVNYFTPDIDFSNYDFLIITSKQIIEALKSYDKGWKKLPVLSVSTPTAQVVKSAGGKILEYGSGYGESLSKIVFSYPKDKKWLYLRAKEVASDFVSTCRQNGYNLDEIVLYETSCSHDILHVEVENDATLIFTSPSSVKCFLKHHIFRETYKIIVIGRTTAKAMPSHVRYVIADEPTIESCIKKVQE